VGELCLTVVLELRNCASVHLTPLRTSIDSYAGAWSLIHASTLKSRKWLTSKIIANGLWNSFMAI
jgi:hypothetical protein